MMSLITCWGKSSRVLGATGPPSRHADVPLWLHMQRATALAGGILSQRGLDAPDVSARQC
jgi:hypothetical protein